MNENISDFTLEQWVLGELSVAEAAKVETLVAENQILQTRVDSIKKHTEEFLRNHPPDQFKAAIEQKAHLRNAQQQYAAPAKSSSLYWRISAGLLAFCMALLVVLPQFNDDELPAVVSEQADPTPEPRYRTKGKQVYLTAHLVETELRLHEGVQVKNQTQLKNGDQVKAGDRIQLSINQALGRSFVIFSIDGSGFMSLHYVTDSKSQLEETNVFAIPNSYRLDDAPKFEDFYLVSSSKPLVADEILAMVEKSLKQQDFQEAFGEMLPPEITIDLLSLKKVKK